MVEWTGEERSIIENIFGSLDYDDIGPKALVRCLIVYPWTQRYFGGFGDLTTVSAIKKNDKIAKHGVVVLRGLQKAADNLDCIKAIYAELSVLHSEKLHVDPDNFRLLGDCLTIVLAAALGAKFTAQVQATFQKFLNVAVSALGKQYH